MDKCIQFVANYDDWVAVKKLSISETPDPIVVMEFVASLGYSFGRKIEENLRKAVELEKVDAVLNEELEGIAGGKKGIETALAAAKNAKVVKAIKEVCDKPELQKKKKKELEEFCRAYALKKALNAAGLKVNYSEIETPSVKAAMKKAKKAMK